MSLQADFDKLFTENKELRERNAYLKHEILLVIRKLSASLEDSITYVNEGVKDESSRTVY